MKFKSAIILASIAFSFACNNSNNKPQTVSNDEILLEETKKIVEEIPRPQSTDLANRLNEAGSGFIMGGTNPTENSSKYITQTQQALNLGVYSADLSYITVYKKTDEISGYIKCFGDLINKLNITPPNSNILERIENNIDNRDSIIYIINEVHETANVILTESERSEVGLLIAVGSWIEGMYLTKETITLAANPAPLWDIFEYNYGALTKINNLLENADSPSEELANIISSLKEIEALLGKIKADRNDEKAKEQIITKIDELRESIV